ncbi:MAG: SDR family NAD(P)-dependent oxidoreductase, partial [Nitrospinota bacterium]
MSVLDHFHLKGRKAVVTGAGGGIGRAIALALADAGADVAAAGRNREPLDALVREIEALGRRGLAVAADVSDEDAVAAFRDRVQEAFGAVHILVNNAGITVRKPILELSLEEWETVLRTNLTGTFLVSRAFGPLLIEQGWGRVINLSSIRMHVTSPGLTAYASSKGGIVPFTKTLALEWVEHGVTANVIAPGYVDTPMVAYVKDLPEVYADTLRPIPMGRWGRPEEVARVAVFLASEASAYITGQVVVVDGGRL